MISLLKVSRNGQMELLSFIGVMDGWMDGRGRSVDYSDTMWARALGTAGQMGYV